MLRHVIMRAARSFFAALAVLTMACQATENREGEAIAAAAEPTPGALLFARAYGGVDARSTVKAHSITTGPGGDIWISGHYLGTVDFGAGPITNADSGSFVTRFDPDGNARWTVAVESAGAHGAKGIAVDADGNAFVGSLVSLTKLSPTGQVLWSKRPVERPRNGSFHEYDIAADGAGGVVLLGWSDERLNVGVVTLPFAAFVLDIDGQGELRWSNLFRQTSTDYLPTGLAVDGMGNTVIAQGTNKGNSLRLTKIDAAGMTCGGQRIPSIGVEDIRAGAIAADAHGNTLFAGGGHARFGDAPVLPGGSWLAKLDPAGALLWWKPLPIWAVTAGPGDEILIVTGFAAAKLDPSGNVLWSRDVLAGVGGAVIACDSGGRMIVAGTFSGVLDLDGKHLSSTGPNAVVLAAFAR